MVELEGQKITATNIVLAIDGLNSFDWTVVQSSTFVLRLSFCAKNPAHRQYVKRSMKLKSKKIEDKND